VTLSARQFEIAKLMAKGKSNKEIATQMNLSLRGIKYHTSVIYPALGLNAQCGHARVEFALWWIKNGDWQKYSDYLKAA
jgi:DNA-binding NarL/FixJ family response regulator